MVVVFNFYRKAYPSEGQEKGATLDQGRVRTMADEAAGKLPNINFNSPKAAPAVLSIGALLWRILAWWENVDFILSVREERVAMSLQLILDYGWIVLILVGIVWFLGAYRTPQDTSKVHWGMVTAVAILAFMTGSLVAVYATGSLPNVFTGWGGDPVNKTCNANFDTSRLVAMREKYHVILVCGMVDSTTDPEEDTRISISRPFSITGQPLGIVVPYGALRSATDTIPQNQSFALWHSAALFPKDIEVSELKRVSDIEKRGGRMIVFPPAGAFSNGMPGTGPMPQTPAPTPPTNTKTEKG